MVGGWGDDNVHCSCTHVGCYVTSTSLARAHMLGAKAMLGGCACFFAV